MHDPYYKRCSANLHESVLHVLQDREALGDFWDRLLGSLDIGTFYIDNLHFWLLHNLLNTKQVEGKD